MYRRIHKSSSNVHGIETGKFLLNFAHNERITASLTNNEGGVTRIQVLKLRWKTVTKTDSKTAVKRLLSQSKYSDYSRLRCSRERKIPGKERACASYTAAESRNDAVRLEERGLINVEKIGSIAKKKIGIAAFISRGNSQKVSKNISRKKKKKRNQLMRDTTKLKVILVSSSETAERAREIKKKFRSLFIQDLTRMKILNANTLKPW